MTFYIPVKIIEEKEAVANHAQELSSFGKKALIVTGKHSAAACGALSDVTRALEDNSTPWALFDRVEENPSVETVMEGRDFGLSEGCDFVIGIGGGSPMDAAKAIAFMMGYPDKGVEYLDEKGPDDAALPIVEIPTTCGTGAEITWVSVLTRPAKHKKGSIPHRLFPKLALVDCTYLLKAPASVINNTSVDALAHLTESYVNTQATEFSRMLVERGLATWKLSKDVLAGRAPMDEKMAEALMHASVLAGMAITHTGTSLPHGMSYPLTMDLGMPHGKACGYFLADYLMEAKKLDQERILKLTGFETMEEMKGFIWSVCEIEKAPRELLTSIAEMILNSPGKLASAPFDCSREVIYTIVGLV